MSKDTSAPVFPIPNGILFGLTKREWLAGIALQGMLASRTIDDGSYTIPETAKDACRYADALLAELNK